MPVFDGIGNPFPLPETVEVPGYHTLRSELVSHIAQHLTKGGLEGVRRNPSEEPATRSPAMRLNFGLFLSNCSRKSDSSTLSGFPSAAEAVTVIPQRGQ